MVLSEYDKSNLSNILNNDDGDWFTAQLLRLIAKADFNNKQKLYQAFPDEVNIVHMYQYGEPYPSISNYVSILREKIGDDTLKLLTNDEAYDAYTLRKILYWKEEPFYGYIPWEIFKTEWVYCPICNSYTHGECIKCSM